MGWDSTRQVPWRRLLTEWAVASVLMIVIFSIFPSLRHPQNYVAIALGGLMYVAVGAALAKFGYQRKSYAEARAEGRAREAQRQMQRRSGAGSRSASAADRAAPPPTRRTNAGNRQRGRRR